MLGSKTKTITKYQGTDCFPVEVAIN